MRGKVIRKGKRDLLRYMTVVILILSFCMQKAIAVHADAKPLSLALELSKDSMKQGESMNVTVSLQNYDENYNENEITTMIIEVSFQTDKISVDKDSIQIKLDKGSGMGFAVAQIKNNSNVELQYVNVGDPLAKGTKDLYSFQITALQNVENLLENISITYAYLQDGTLAESVRLTTVPCVLVDGEVREPESIDEKFTSEYGTNVATVTPDTDKNKDTSSTATTGASEVKGENKTTGNNGNSDGQNQNQNENTTSVSSADSQETDGTNKDKETATKDSEELTGEKADDDQTDVSDKKSNKDKKTGKTEKTETAAKGGKTGVIVAVIVVLLAVAAGISVFLYKKNGKKMTG